MYCWVVFRYAIDSLINQKNDYVLGYPAELVFDFDEQIDTRKKWN